jgi:hypothetical protein
MASSAIGPITAVRNPGRDRLSRWEAVIRFPTVEPERAQNHTSDADSDARCERTQLDVSRPRSIKIQFECELVHTSPSRIAFLIFVALSIPDSVHCWASPIK